MPQQHYKQNRFFLNAIKHKFVDIFVLQQYYLIRYSIFSIYQIMLIKYNYYYIKTSSRIITVLNYKDNFNL